MGGRKKTTGKGGPRLRKRGGNPSGGPKGARKTTTLGPEALSAGEVEDFTREAVDLTTVGNVTAICLSLDRFLPTGRDRQVPFEAPEFAWDLQRDDARDGWEALAQPR